MYPADTRRATRRSVGCVCAGIAGYRAARTGGVQLHCARRFRMSIDVF